MTTAVASQRHTLQARDLSTKLFSTEATAAQSVTLGFADSRRVKIEARIERFNTAQRWDQPGVGQYVERPTFVIIEHHARRWAAQEERNNAVPAPSAAQAAAIAVDEHRVGDSRAFADIAAARVDR